MRNNEGNRREFLQIMAAAMAATAQPAAPADKNQPNLVYVFADQMRFCDMGCAGNEQIRTPNLDKLSADALRLTNCYSAAPLCTTVRLPGAVTFSPSHRGA